jgi:tRNA nucleotidyltransferase (CCA-adding enzyme)
LDLHRRDFTINTLALRLDGQHYGELHDYWGGLADLRQGFVRVLHSLSFVDDPTRILRAVRFEQRFDFRIEARTLDLLLDAGSLLERISGDRIRHEFDNILGEDRAISIMDRLGSLGIIQIIHPDLVWDDWIASRLTAWKSFCLSESWVDLIKPQGKEWRIFVSYILWLLRLSPEQACRVCERLKLPAQLKRMVQSASALYLELNDLSKALPSAATMRLESVEPLALLGVYLAAETDASRHLLECYVSKWRNITPTYSGHDLRARGVPPGPVYKDVLNALRRAWLDGTIVTADDEKALIEDLLIANNH